MLTRQGAGNISGKATASAGNISAEATRTPYAPCLIVRDLATH
jgi:hypothetical protein